MYGRLINVIPAESKTEEDKLKMKLLYDPMPMPDIEHKIHSTQYYTFLEFMVDVKRIVHNVSVLYGSQSLPGKEASEAYKRALTETNFARDCFDCFRIYYEQAVRNRDYFLIPCNPPHQLVYAKLSTYPYWPAKVLRHDNETVAVKFFGVKHETACIAYKDVVPINTQNLPPPRMKNLKDACEELHRHQNVLRTNNVYVPPFIPHPSVANRTFVPLAGSNDYLSDLSDEENLDRKYRPPGKMNFGRGRGRGGRGSRGGRMPPGSSRQQFKKEQHMNGFGDAPPPMRNGPLSNVKPNARPIQPSRTAPVFNGVQPRTSPGQSMPRASLPPKKRLTLDEEMNKGASTSREPEVQNTPPNQGPPKKRMKADAELDGESFVRRSNRVRSKTLRYSEEVTNAKSRIKAERDLEEDEIDEEEPSAPPPEPADAEPFVFEQEFLELPNRARRGPQAHIINNTPIVKKERIPVTNNAPPAQPRFGPPPGARGGPRGRGGMRGRGSRGRGGFAPTTSSYMKREPRADFDDENAHINNFGRPFEDRYSIVSPRDGPSASSSSGVVLKFKRETGPKPSTSNGFIEHSDDEAPPYGLLKKEASSFYGRHEDIPQRSGAADSSRMVSVCCV